MSEVYGKTCCTCKQFLVFEKFNKCKGTKDGYRKQCQECRRAQSRKRYAEIKDSPEYKESRRGSIQCKRCGEWREVACLRSVQSKGSDCFKCNADKSRQFRARPEVKALYSERAKKQIAEQGVHPNFLHQTRDRTGENSGSWKGGLPNCIDCGLQLSTRKCTRCRACSGKQNSGEANWKWKGGYSADERKTPKYKHWRSAVFERDDYKCQICFCRGGTLTAHHIKRWATYKELRFDINNGATLCHSCHSLVHQGNWHLEPLSIEEAKKIYESI